MAKKAPKKPVEPVEPPSTIAKAKTVVAKAAERVADAVSVAAHAAKDHVVTPVAEAVGIVKKKKTRPVRPKKQTPTVPVPLPARSTKAAGKMMSKNIVQAPKDTSKSQTKSKTKPKA